MPSPRSRRKRYLKRPDALFSQNFLPQHRRHGRDLASVQPLETHDLVDPSLGKFEISMERIDTPPSEPYRLKVSSICSDGRENHHAFKPKKEVLIKDENGGDGITVCDFISHAYNSEDKKLTLNYMRSSETGHCNAEWSQSFDLKQICAAWTE